MLRKLRQHQHLRSRPPSLHLWRQEARVSRKMAAAQSRVRVEPNTLAKKCANEILDYPGFPEVRQAYNGWSKWPYVISAFLETKSQTKTLIILRKKTVRDDLQKKIAAARRNNPSMRLSARDIAQAMIDREFKRERAKGNCGHDSVILDKVRDKLVERLQGLL